MPLCQTPPRHPTRQLVWLVALGLLVTEAAAQGDPAVVPSFQPHRVNRQTRRIDQQLEALATDEAWGETLDLLESPEIDRNDLVEALPPPADIAGHKRYTPFSWWCQNRLARLPGPASQAWRDRVGSLARRRFEGAAALLDERELVRIAEQFFATPAASEALLAASELALERGDFKAARRRLQRLHPLASDPLGRPAGIAMANIDPNARPMVLAEAWRADPRPTDLLTAPPDDRLLPVVLARLTLVSIREGDLSRAASELRLLRALAPNATGRLAGREQPLAEALAALIAEEVVPEAPRSFGPLWEAWETPLLPQDVQPDAEPDQERLALNQQAELIRRLAAQQRNLRAAPLQQASLPSPLLRVVVVDGTAYYLRQGRVFRTDLLTGETVPSDLPGIATAQQETREEAPAAAAANQQGLVIQNNGGRLVVNGRQALQIGPDGTIVYADPEPARPVVNWLLAGQRHLIACVGAPPNAGAFRRLNRRGFVAPTAGYLLGIDTDQPSEPAFRLELPETEESSGWFFGPTLTTRDERLFVLVERQGPRREVGLACYDTRLSKLRWFTKLGSGSQGRFSPGASDGSITLAGDTAYVSTDLGGVAALDASRGTVRWVTAPARPLRTVPAAGTSPQLVVAGDRVLTVEGGDQLVAWDAATGRPLWAANRSADSAIVGVTRDHERSVVVLAGQRVAAYDTLTGVQTFVWPDNDHAGLRGHGTAALRGGEVFWPTRNALFTLDALTGRMTRPPRDLSRLGGDGAHLLATDHGLLMAGTERIRLLTDGTPFVKPERARRVSRLKAAAVTKVAQQSNP